jgi:hypothetical protein
MIGAIKIAELLGNELLWPMWAKVWITFWLGIAVFYTVLAYQQRWAKRKAIESQRSWHLRLSRLVEGRKCGIPQKPVAAVVREDVQFLDSPPQTPLE